MSSEKKSIAVADRYKPYIARIKKYINPKWLTISPPTEDIKGDDFIEKYYTIFMKWLSCTRDYIAVVESANYRFHWHIMLDIKDEYSWGIKFRGMVKYMKCQIKIYKGFPQHGIEYLFKDIEETKTQLKYLDPIITRDEIEDIYEQLKEQRAEERRLADLEEKEMLKRREHHALLESRARVFMRDCPVFAPDSDSDTD